MIFYHVVTKELRELPEELMTAWTDAQNPKAAEWLPAPAKPAESAEWVGGEWVIPAPVIPENVSARQIRIWLIRHGISLATVDAAINAIPDQPTRDIVRVEWEFAPYVERTHPMLIPLAAALGLTSEQVDQAFIEAALI